MHTWFVCCVLIWALSSDYSDTKASLSSLSILISSFLGYQILCIYFVCLCINNYAQNSYAFSHICLFVCVCVCVRVSVCVCVCVCDHKKHPFTYLLVKWLHTKDTYCLLIHFICCQRCLLNLHVLSHIESVITIISIHAIVFRESPDIFHKILWLKLHLI